MGNTLYRIYGLKPAVFTQALEDAGTARLEVQLQELAEAALEARSAPNVCVSQALCDPYLRFALVLGFSLAALQQLCGINALMSYSNSLFNEGGIPPASLTLARWRWQASTYWPQ